MGRKSSIDRMTPEVKAYIQAMLASGIDYTIFFYNPNIHPLKEYELRKNENIRFAEQFGVPFVDADYDADSGELVLDEVAAAASRLLTGSE